MSKFTPESINVLQQDIIKALKAVEKKHNVTLNLERATKSFWHHSVGFNLTAILSNPYRENYIKHAAEVGAKPEWLDRDFNTPSRRNFWGDDFRVVGLNLPNEIVCDKLKNGKLTGKHCSFSVEQIAAQMAKATVQP